MKITFHPTFAILLVLSSAALAGPRISDSGDYIITTDTLDAGGSRAPHASATYSNDGSLGLITGVTRGAATAETSNAGTSAGSTRPLASSSTRRIRR